MKAGHQKVHLAPSPHHPLASKELLWEVTIYQWCTTPVESPPGMRGQQVPKGSIFPTGMENIAGLPRNMLYLPCYQGSMEMQVAKRLHGNG